MESSAEGDACGVVTPSVLKSMFHIVFLCVAGVDYNAIVVVVLVSG